MKDKHDQLVQHTSLGEKMMLRDQSQSIVKVFTNLLLMLLMLLI